MGSGLDLTVDGPSERRLRVAAFTAGAEVPAARFRVRQYAAPLARLGIELAEYWPGSGSGADPPPPRLLRPAWLAGALARRLPQLVAARRADLVLLQCQMISTLPALEGLARRPRVADIDAAIHLDRGGLAAQRFAGRADLVIVGNAFLAETWHAWNRAVEILPTPVDTAAYPQAPPPERPAIGWIGRSADLPYLQAIAPALEAVLARFPAAELAVCCDRPPVLGGLPVRYHPWSEAAELPFLASLSIGLMPLADGPRERGRCGMAMLHYMAAGRACVVSPVGMNSEVLARGEIGLAADTHAEWTGALCALLADRDAARRLGETGRRVAEEHYSLAVLAPRLAALLRRIA